MSCSFKSADSAGRMNLYQAVRVATATLFGGTRNVILMVREFGVEIEYGVWVFNVL